MEFNKIILRIWNYVRNSWEGEDGKFSYKRASQFLFVALLSFMVLRDRVNSPWQFYTFLVIAILFSLTAAIITVPQLILMLKYYSKTKKFDYWNPQPADSSTTTTQPPVEQVPEETNK